MRTLTSLLILSITFMSIQGFADGEFLPQQDDGALWLDEFDPAEEGALDFLDYLEVNGAIESAPDYTVEKVGGCRYPLKAIVSRAKQRLYIYRNCSSQPSYVWKTSTGASVCKKKNKAGKWYKGNCTTPPYTGTAKGRYGHKGYSSGKYPGGGCGSYGNMAYAVFYNGGYAIHGTCSEAKLGRPASHGCTRITRANAKVFQQMVKSVGHNNAYIQVK